MRERKQFYAHSEAVDLIDEMVAETERNEDPRSATDTPMNGCGSIDLGFRLAAYFRGRIGSGQRGCWQPGAIASGGVT